MKRIIFFCHSNYLSSEEIFDSHWSLTFEFLNNFFGSDYEVLRHSLYRGGQSRIYKKGVNGKYITIPLIGKFPDIFRYFLEVGINTTYLLLRIFSRRRLLIIAIDPLSCLAGVILKRMGFNLNVIFITPDFAKERFGNKFLNWAYFVIDKFCTKNCDFNYCSSLTVIEYKRKLYANIDLSSKLVHYPNVPAKWQIKKCLGIEKVSHRLIYVGIISSQIKLKKILDVMFELGHIYANLNLVIVGDGDKKMELEAYAKKHNMNNVFFMGNLAYEDALKEIAKAEIGIALYEGNLNYDEFRDSCKIREYQALGVIPLASCVAKANVDEIRKYKSGILIENDVDIKEEIKKIFDNMKYKAGLINNCNYNYKIYENKFDKFYEVIEKL